MLGLRPRFNEAEARASESRDVFSDRPGDIGGFNEAEARASESPRAGSSHVRGSVSRASMRPRRVPRNHCFCMFPKRPTMNRFNEAEARASESPRLDAGMLVKIIGLQ